ncbi:MAG: HAD family phosphatase [Clostridiales bacterium]|nr:HAD family phosphatase [Clostridiales bacterium]
MIKGVIFDNDGVILDSMGIWAKVSENLIRFFGLEPDAGLIKVLASKSIEEATELMKEKTQINKSNEEIIRLIKEELDKMYFSAEKKPGIENALSFLKSKNIPMVIASSGMRYHIEKSLSNHGLLKYFDNIFTNTEIGSSKSSPEIFLSACEFLNIKPENCLVVEDSLYALRTAEKAGFITMGVSDNYNKENQQYLKAEADFYIDNMSEFKSALFGIV